MCRSGTKYGPFFSNFGCTIEKAVAKGRLRAAACSTSVQPGEIAMSGLKHPPGSNPGSLNVAGLVARRTGRLSDLTLFGCKSLDDDQLI